MCNQMNRENSLYNHEAFLFILDIALLVGIVCYQIGSTAGYRTGYQAATHEAEQREMNRHRIYERR